MRHIVTGYHGTDAASAASIVRGQFKPGNTGWFGSAIYFWEQDSGRALRWARTVVKAPKPTVVQAELDLSTDILDLTAEDEARSYENFIRGLATKHHKHYSAAFAHAKQAGGFADSVWVEVYRRALYRSATPRRVACLRAVVLEASGYSATTLETAVRLVNASGDVARSRVVTKIAVMVAVYDAAQIGSVSIFPH
jgi:hypothetical protein